MGLLMLPAFRDMHIHLDKTIDYYNGFNIWMKAKTKEWWEGGIDYWEGKSWRHKNSC